MNDLPFDPTDVLRRRRRRRRCPPLLRRRSRGWLAGALGLAVAFWAVLATGAEQAEPPGVVDLAGEWRMAVGTEPRGAAPELDDGSWRRVTLPASWRQLELEGVSGPVWLRRTVQLPTDWRRRYAPEELAVRIGAAAHGSYRLYAGGELMGVHGGADRSLPTPRDRVFPLPPAAVRDGGRLVLALRFDRFRRAADRVAASSGPVGGGVLLGDRATLEAEATRERLRSSGGRLLPAVLLALLIAAGLGHLAMFLANRQSVEFFWLGVALLEFSVMAYFAHWGDALGSYALAHRLYQASAHLLMVLMIQFLWSFLARPIGRWLRAYQLSHLALAGFVLLVPGFDAVLVSHLGRWLWGLLGWGLLASMLVRAVRSRDLEVRIVGFAGSVVVAVGVCEWVVRALGWGTLAPLPMVVGTLFAAAMTVALSSRFQRFHGELERLRWQLEQMVEDRTQELEAANRKLHSEISERQLAEEAMRMLERAVEQSIDGILVADLEGEIQYVNRAWAGMHGYEDFEVMGRDLSLFHTPEQLEELRPCLEEVRETGAFDGEIDHRRKDGETFPSWMSITLLRDAETGPVGFVFVGRDVSERAQAEEERNRLETKVKQARKLESLGDLAGGIAHDYNNLLTGMLGNAGLVLRELPESSTARDKIEQIETAAVRAADLTSQLLAYAGEDPLVLRAVDAGEVVRGMGAELRALMTPGVELEIRVEPELPEVEADPAQIRRALRNLVDNADEAMGGEPGTVAVAVGLCRLEAAELAETYLEDGQGAGDYLCLGVRDTGCGIDEEIRSRMFDPFFSTRASARGLGLAAVFGIVRAHGGVIRVASELDVGTTFELFFPLTHPRLQKPSQDPEAAVAAAPALDGYVGSGTVLVVDDEALMREVSESILEESGFQVQTAVNGQEAVELFRRDPSAYRVVLLDRTMPVMSGVQALEEIRRLEPAARVILMSGYRESEVLRGLEDKGLSGFLQKPFRPDDLLRKVREALEAADAPTAG
jgi:PAS domain S-box-containing protein